MSVPSTLITTYLEMNRREQFVPSFIETTAQVLPMARYDLPFYRFLYREVGKNWRWYDRLAYDDEKLAETLSYVTVYVLYADGVPAGYVELEPQAHEIEIAYFGLRPEFIGRGLGKHLLSYGIQQAWMPNHITRVWLHTCNLDSPQALKNYQARGFQIYRETSEPMPTLYQG
jgi:GNAT superfamily N-acetyltransferase